MAEDLGVGPLMQARAQLDQAIDGYLEKVALLRKRREAIQLAVDTLRSSDDELRSLIACAPRARGVQEKRVVTFDEDQVEKAVIEYLGTHKKASYADIAYVLDSAKIQYSAAGLKRVLKTSPHVVSEGTRAYLRWRLK